MALKQLTVFVENKQGSVVPVTDALAKGEIGKSRYESYLKLYEKAMQINEWELK